MDELGLSEIFAVVGGCHAVLGYFTFREAGARHLFTPKR